MAPLHDPVFQWDIRTIPINGTRNKLDDLQRFSHSLSECERSVGTCINIESWCLWSLALLLVVGMSRIALPCFRHGRFRFL